MEGKQQKEMRSTSSHNTSSGSSFRLLGEGDIKAIVAALRQDNPGNCSEVQTPPAPSFIRNGFASQYEFNENV